MKSKYWFKPKRFWGWFAAYYPVSWQGWVISLACLMALVVIFRVIDQRSHSVSDTLISVAPWFVLIGLIFDLATHWRGEYPWWWKKK